MLVVGRETELEALLHQLIGAVETSSGRSLFLQGPPGVGKTALVTELLERLARDHPELTLARGRCQRPLSNPDPYLPFVDALRDLADESTPGFVRPDTVSDLLSELAPYWLPVIPVVGNFLSAGFLTALRMRGRPKTAPSQEALFVQYLDLIERLSQRAPLVLFLDDLQWVDRASVGLLSHLCRGIARLPVVLVGALQPEEGEAEPNPIYDLIGELEREQLATTLQLAELGEEAVVQLLSAELGGAVSEPLRRQVLEVAGGNPLFVGELCRLLRQTGAVAQEGEIWQLADPAGRIQVPRSAQAVLGQRIERLDPDTVRLLQYASVQGNEFSATALARLLEVDELTMLDRLDELERKEQLVKAVGETVLAGGEFSAVFRFASPILQTVLYEQLMGKRRILLHRRTGEVLRELFHDRIPLIAGELAWHFEEGRVPEEAERYARVAAGTARDARAELTRLNPAPPPPPVPALDQSSAPAGGEAASEPSSDRIAFVGRTDELELLLREVTLATELSAGRCLFVQGPPGAGKTTLVGELLDRIGREQAHLTIARGRCLPTFGSADPYLPFVEALRDISDETTLGFDEKESFSDLLADIAPYWISTVPVVGGLITAALSTAAVLRGGTQPDAAPSREALFVQYVDLLRRLAERSPLVLFLDDLHWADQSSVALLAHIARGIERLPVVVIGTLRDDEAVLQGHPLLPLLSELRHEELARTLQLEELPPEALGALLSAEFGGDLSEPLRRWIVETAGGNPLFASELARLLKQSGAVAEVQGEWFLTEAVRDLGVPRSVEAVIEKRIQRLDPAAARLLQYASVEGDEFSSLVVSRLLEQDELEVLEQVELLARRHQLVRIAGEVVLPGGELATLIRFRHTLVQTVLYRQVVGKRRMLLHRRTAQLLEAQYADEAEAIAGKLARHFHQGRVRPSAFRYARAAADAARRVYAHWEAEELYKIALEHSPDLVETARLEERLGDVYGSVGYYANGITTYQSALEKTGPDAAPALRLRRKIVVLERKAGTTPGPLLLQQVSELLERASDLPAERCHLLLELGRLPDAVGAVEAAAEALRIARSLDDSSLLAVALELYARVLILGGRPREALPYLEQALVHSNQDPVRLALNHNFAGIACAKLGEYDSARMHFEAMLQTAERISEPNQVSTACGCLGRLLLRTGQLDEAEAMLQRARIAHERRDRSLLVYSLDNLGERARLAGEPAVARDYYQKLLEEAIRLGSHQLQAHAWAGIGTCLLDLNLAGEARECAERARAALADRPEWFEGREVVETFLARMEAAGGNANAAEQRLARAAQVLERGDVYLWARVELQRARLLGLRDAAGARALLQRVASSVESIQSPPLHAEIAAVREQLRSTALAARPVQT